MAQFFSLPFSDEVRRKILWDNCARLYRIDAPARTNGAGRVSAGHDRAV
jgi:hypothetical protein